jgi:tetratricopeptide (TPR) repeat protein
MKICALALVAVFLISTARVARCEDKEAAKLAFAEARRFYALNEFDHALDSFKRAYLAYEDPTFLFNIAQCHRQLGNKADAVKFFRSYLRDAPNAPNREEVLATLTTLGDELRAEKTTAAAAPAVATSVDHVARQTANSALTRAPQAARTPAYKRWWVWTLVGVAAAGAATGIALGVTSRKSEGAFMPVMVTR